MAARKAATNGQATKRARKVLPPAVSAKKRVDPAKKTVGVRELREAEQVVVPRKPARTQQSIRKAAAKAAPKKTTGSRNFSIKEPLVTIFMPTHDDKYLMYAAKSVMAQTHHNWELIVLANGAADAELIDYKFSKWADRSQMRKVKVVQADASVKGVGAAKKEALKLANEHSQIYIELDHDDVILPTCVAKVVAAFESNPDSVFVYSDSSQINADGTPNDHAFRADYGWEYEWVDIAEVTTGEVDGTITIPKAVYRCKSFEPTPHNVNCIWFAPNHVRAFRKWAYEMVDGYDEKLMHLDDQALMAALYSVGEFVHIPEVLYLQRVHPGNTQSQEETNIAIQIETWDMYERNVEDSMKIWAQRRGLKCIELGAGNTKRDGYVTVDQEADTNPDVCVDIEQFGLCDFEDNSVAIVRCVDFIEHIRDVPKLMSEIHRVLAPGGMLMSLTPSTDGRGAFQDPTHVSFLNENSFWYYTDRKYMKFSPQIKHEPRFQVSVLRTIMMSEWHRNNNLPYVQANLIAVKDEAQPRNGGELKCLV